MSAAQKRELEDGPSALADVQAALVKQICDAHQHSEALNIVGGDTKSFYGREPVGAPLHTREYSGIVAYEPSELVVTVCAGTRLSELEQLLAEENQMLAFEPPRYGRDGTVGGAVAAGLSGPRRPYAGALRDAMLGVRLVSGSGEVLRFGGQVMKNVAGYDVSRLMVGAMGTLGLLLAVSLRVAPRPDTEITIAWDLSTAEAHQRMLGLAQKPWPISALSYVDGSLYLRLSGQAQAIADASERLQPDRQCEGDLWDALRDQAHEFFATPDPLWRLSVAPAAPMPGELENSLWEWGGALRWCRPQGLSENELRTAAKSMGGHATRFRGTGRDESFTPLDPVNLKLQKRLKERFDPCGVLNPGRLFAEF